MNTPIEMSLPVKTTFSFRTEMAADLNTFIKAIADDEKLGIYIASVHTDERTGESAVEIATYQRVTLEQLLEVMRAIPDSHVMMQTLRQVPLKENPLKRDYSVV